MSAMIERRTDSVLIAGGSSGMGLSLARSLLADGASVVIAGRSSDRLAQAAASLAEVGDVRTIAATLPNSPAIRGCPSRRRRHAVSNILR
jgi:NAD(P)-dependent dehydrogenase (short-subunit alcohol dehydrogenase family)